MSIYLSIYISISLSIYLYLYGYLSIYILGNIKSALIWLSTWIFLCASSVCVMCRIIISIPMLNQISTTYMRTANPCIDIYTHANK